MCVCTTQLCVFVCYPTVCVCATQLCVFVCYPTVCVFATQLGQKSSTRVCALTAPLTLIVSLVIVRSDPAYCNCGPCALQLHKLQWTCRLLQFCTICTVYTLEMQFDTICTPLKCNMVQCIQFDTIYTPLNCNMVQYVHPWNAMQWPVSTKVTWWMQQRKLNPCKIPQITWCIFDSALWSAFYHFMHFVFAPKNTLVPTSKTTQK